MIHTRAAFLRSFALSKSALLIIFLCVFVGLVCSQTVQASHAEQKKDSNTESKRNPKVLIVSIPRVSWKSIEGIRTPNFDALGESGSVANLSVRVTKGGQTIEKGYASLSAGHRASATSSSSSTFLEPGELLDGHPASSIYEKEQGKVPTNAAALSLGFELSRNQSDEDLSPATIGAFAQAISDANKSIAVFGNSDSCSDSVRRCRDRPVGYLGSNTEGVLKNGNVSSNLLDSIGMLDMKKMEIQARASIKKNDVTVVECSNLERADRAASESAQKIADKRFADAVVECDGFVGKLRKQIDLDKDQIYVISPMSSVSVEELTVFIAAGNSIEPGYSVSGITRRSGIVALADIAPTVLNFLEIDRPSSMVDTLLGWNYDSASLESRKEALIQVNERALIRDRSFNSVATLFVVIVFGGVILSVASRKKYRKLLTSAKFVSLFSLVMPTTTFLMLPFMLFLGSPFAVSIAFISLSALFSFIAFRCGERWNYTWVVLVISGIALLTQLVDILFGGNLQLNSLFGYSAIVAGRFAGFGNLTFSIVSISTVLVVATLKQLSTTHVKWNEKKVNVCLVLLFVIVLVIVGAPWFGSDVGGVLALTPTVVIASLMLFDKKIGIKAFVVSGVVTVASISIFSLFDLNRPASERTHLGRFVEVLVKGDAGVVIEGKIVSNINILTNSVFASVIVVSTLFLMYLFLYPERFIQTHAKDYPVFRFIAYPGLVAAGLGMFLNDSGAAIPGMMIAMAFPAAMLLISDMNRELSSKNHHENQSNTTSISESV